MKVALFISLSLAAFVVCCSALVACCALKNLWHRKRPAHRSNESERGALRESAAVREEAILSAKGKPYARGIRASLLAPRVQEVRKDPTAAIKAQTHALSRHGRLVALATQAIRALPYFRQMRTRDAASPERNEEAPP